MKTRNSPSPFSFHIYGDGGGGGGCMRRSLPPREQPRLFLILQEEAVRCGSKILLVEKLLETFRKLFPIPYPNYFQPQPHPPQLPPLTLFGNGNSSTTTTTMEDETSRPGRGRARGRARTRYTPAGELVEEAGQAEEVAASSVVGDTTTGSGSVASFSESRGMSSEASSDVGEANDLPRNFPEGSEVGSARPSSLGISPSYDVASDTSSAAGSRRAASNYAEDSSVVKTIKDGFNKVGTAGQPVDVTTNYYVMNKSPNFKLYQYRVDFLPVEDNTKLKKAILRQHEDKIGSYVFDGSILYMTKVIAEELKNLRSIPVPNSTINQSYEIKIRLVGQVNPEDSMYLQFYNIVMRKAMNLIQMEEIGRNMYDRNLAIKFPEDKIELWPGFATAIRNHEVGTLLCVEVTHKVLRTNTVLNVMMAIKRPNMSMPDYEKAVRAEVEDSIVMTHYNRRTYQVSNIDFNVTPSSTFRGQDGTIQTYAEYYLRRYQIEIPPELMKQPMLVSHPKKKDVNKGVTGDIYLIPSLCNPTGLSDDMRKNFTLMKKLSTHLHMDPVTRKRKLDEFMQKLRSSPQVQAEFRSWDVDFDPVPLEAVARVLPREGIAVGPNADMPISPDEKGDWTRGLKGKRMLTPAVLKKWVMFAPQRDMPKVRGFLTTLKKAGAEIGFQVSDPLAIVDYDINRVEHAVLERKMEQYGTLELVFFVLPNNSLRIYSEIKNFTTLTLGIPSQCYLAKNLEHKNVQSVASKVMIQVTAKLGGVPWAIKVPLKKLMVLGFDVYHCSTRKGYSAGALVATSNPHLTSYYSLVSFHKDKSELANNLCEDFATMLTEFRSKNGYLPDRIMMFRDGVGEGQIQFVLDNEVAQMKVAMREIYGDTMQEPPKLTFVIVTKKINTRAFLNGRQNLMIGTVMDTCITLPERYDFFLVSQDVRQGTVSPTNYNVVYDEMDIKPDHMQRMAYKLCHLYYNWSGTVAVPAPCQYAHKLAYLTGVAVGERAMDSLHDKLWYL